MKIIKRKEDPLNRRNCESCGCLLEFEKEDVVTGAYGCAYIVCPECGNKIYLEDGKYDKKITHSNVEFPKDFSYADKEECVHMSDGEIQEYVYQVAKKLKEGEPFSFTGSGDTFVFGFHMEDEDEIIVAKNYYDTEIYLD